jgi:hypothetical protein
MLCDDSGTCKNLFCIFFFSGDANQYNTYRTHCSALTDKEEKIVLDNSSDRKNHRKSLRSPPWYWMSGKRWSSIRGLGRTTNPILVGTDIWFRAQRPNIWKRCLCLLSFLRMNGMFLIHWTIPSSVFQGNVCIINSQEISRIYNLIQLMLWATRTRPLPSRIWCAWKPFFSVISFGPLLLKKRVTPLVIWTGAHKRTW